MTRNHEAICEALRSAVIGVYGTPDGNCIAAAAAIKSVYPDAEIYYTQVAGAGYDYAHYVAVLDGYMLDVTCDQFGPSFDEVIITDFAFARSHRRATCYYNFADANDVGNWDRQFEMNAAFRAALEVI